MKTTIRPAIPADSGRLTEISFASKRYWHYPELYMKIWEKELTVSPAYIEQNDVWVYEQDGDLVAYYSIIRLGADMNLGEIRLQKGVWLDHMFVSTDYIGSGIGCKLYSHMCEIYGKRKERQIRVLADPNARGFYQRMGARYCGEVPSTIPGRSTPLLEITLNGH